MTLLLQHTEQSQSMICNFLLTLAVIGNRNCIVYTYYLRDISHIVDENHRFCPRHCIMNEYPQWRNAQHYQHNLYIVVKYFQWATILSLAVWVHSFSCLFPPNCVISCDIMQNKSAYATSY